MRCDERVGLDLVPILGQFVTLSKNGTLRMLGYW